MSACVCVCVCVCSMKVIINEDFGLSLTTFLPFNSFNRILKTKAPILTTIIEDPVQRIE